MASNRMRSEERQAIIEDLLANGSMTHNELFSALSAQGNNELILDVARLAEQGKIEARLKVGADGVTPVVRYSLPVTDTDDIPF